MSRDQIDLQALQPFYRRMSELIGTDAMIAIWQEFRGAQLTLPIHLYERSLVITRVRELYTGDNARALATKYGYSEKWVRHIVKGYENEK